MKELIKNDLVLEKVKEVVIAFARANGKEIPDDLDPITDPINDIGLKSRDGPDIAVALSIALDIKLPEECNPLVEKYSRGKNGLVV